eukprot:NODE_479_length_6970_cov_0.750982.p2 type:complete len:420 gc:universal NODE_479_length_6970_cov_0.750982:2527-1268(-)
MSIPRMLLTLLALFANKWQLAAGYEITKHALVHLVDKYTELDMPRIPYFDGERPQFYSSDEIRNVARDHPDLPYRPSPELNHLMVANELRMAIVSNSLEVFYPNPELVDRLAIQICEKMQRNRKTFEDVSKMLGNEAEEEPLAEAYKLARLALYDVHMLIDDSGSIFRDGHRKYEIIEFTSMLVEIVSEFDTDGLDLCYMTWPGNFKYASKAEFQKGFPISGGWTPTGTALFDKVIQPLFREKAQFFKKPVLVYLLTDGIPLHGFSDLDSNTDAAAARLLVENVFLDTHALKQKYGMPETAIEFGIGQIGDDGDAAKWINGFDNSPEIGETIDVTDDFQSEAGQITGLKKWQWRLKFILGAIDPELDSLDTVVGHGLHDAALYFDLSPEVLEKFNPVKKLEHYNAKIEEIEKNLRKWKA